MLARVGVRISLVGMCVVGLIGTVAPSALGEVLNPTNCSDIAYGPWDDNCKLGEC